MRIFLFCLGSAFQSLLIITFLISHAQATTYTVVDLGPGIAMDINSSGEVVGSFPHLGGNGFYWREYHIVYFTIPKTLEWPEKEA
jgi:hypothetical protein